MVFRPERMSRVLLVGVKEALPGTVDYLYRSGRFHVVDFSASDEIFDIGEPLPGADLASARLLKMMAISRNVGLEGEEFEPEEPVPASRIRAEVDAAIFHMETEISGMVHARTEMTGLLAQKRNQLAAVMPFDGIEVHLHLLTGYASLSTFSGRFRSDPEPDIRSITPEYEIFRGREACVILVAREHADTVAKLLPARGFTEVQLPDARGRPAEIISRLRSEIAELEGRLARLDGRITAIKERHRAFIRAAIEELSIEANMAESPLRFGTGRHSFFIDAWVPSGDVGALGADLESACGEGVVMIDLGEASQYVETQEEPESIPVKLVNPKPARPMEMLLEMFSLPDYDEADPSLVMLLTFPLFYGLMLGDFGYGIILVLLTATGLFQRGMSRLGMGGGAPALGRILLYSGISSIIFGYLYDEFFGFEILGHHAEFELMGIHFPVHRASPEMVAAMLVFCVYLGAAHLFIGYVIGLRNASKSHGTGKAVLEKGGWLLILTGFMLFSLPAVRGLLSGTGLDFGNPAISGGLALLVTGIVMNASVEGINGILELPGMASNLLSYTRIYAIGLSSVGIALAFNEDMAMPLIEEGGAGLAMGALVLVAGHTLNLALGIIGPLIQSLRLHYVEFFTKFYRGGGLKFSPLAYRRKYTKEV